MSFARAHLLLENGDRIAFWFNPTTLRTERRASYNRRGGAAREAPTLEYLGTKSEALSLELLLHAYGEQSSEALKAKIEDVEKLVEPTIAVRGAAARSRPQRVWLVWGSYMSAVSVCTSVSATVELFDSDGSPLRATVAIVLTQAAPEPGGKGQNPTTRATQRRRSHLVHAGDTLAGIAYAHYRDPTRWRQIAEANEIEDPLRLNAGTHITVPLEEG